MAAVTSLKVPVLMYHEIADVTSTPSALTVTPEAFADQLAYLRDAGFTAVTAGALAKILAGGAGALPERPVVLTFDDGYADFYSRALPLLKQYGHTATLFQTTGWVDTLLGSRRMLNWCELSEIAEAGIRSVRTPRGTWTRRDRDRRALPRAPGVRPAVGRQAARRARGS